MAVFRSGCNFLLTFIVLMLRNNVSADTSVWEVKFDSNTVYLGGTVHLLRPSDYPLPTNRPIRRLQKFI